MEYPKELLDKAQRWLADPPTAADAYTRQLVNALEAHLRFASPVEPPKQEPGIDLPKFMTEPQDYYQRAYAMAKDLSDWLAVRPASLLRPATLWSEGPGVVGCNCPPDRCGAPVVMGVQTPCRRASPVGEQPEPSAATVGQVEAMKLALALVRAQHYDMVACRCWLCSAAREAGIGALSENMELARKLPHVTFTGNDSSHALIDEAIRAAVPQPRSKPPESLGGAQQGDTAGTEFSPTTGAQRQWLCKDYSATWYLTSSRAHAEKVKAETGCYCEEITDGLPGAGPSATAENKLSCPFCEGTGRSFAK